MICELGESRFFTFHSKCFSYANGNCLIKRRKLMKRFCQRCFVCTQKFQRERWREKKSRRCVKKPFLLKAYLHVVSPWWRFVFQLTDSVSQLMYSIAIFFCYIETCILGVARACSMSIQCAHNSRAYTR